MIRSTIATWLVGLSLALCSSPALAQPTWIALDVGRLPGGGGEAMDINNPGDIVGYSHVGPGLTSPIHAFLWTRSDGTLDLGTLGGTTSSAYGINDARQVVGMADTGGGQSHAFIWTAASGMVDLGTLGGTFSRATAINNHGVIIGSWATSDTSNYRPFRWTSATGMVDLTTAMGAAGFTFLHAINDLGDIVGSDANGAFIWTPARGRTNLPGASNLRLDLNNRSQVAATRTASTSPIVWTAAGGFADVAAPSPAFSEAIDDNGLVALGYYPFGSGAGPGVAVSSSEGPFYPLSTASGDWRGLPRAISAAGVVGSGDGGPYFWCRGGAPTIADAAAAPNLLQPATGQLVTVGVNYAATGRCGHTTNFLEVYSNEPDEGNHDGLPDIVIVDTHTVRLRAEHLASGSGRTYTIRIRSIDDYGYAATQAITVHVPVSGGGGGMTGVTLTTSVPSPQPAGTSIVLSAFGVGGVPPYAYRFWAHSWVTGTWQVLCDWSTASTCVWPAATVGGHDLLVEARRDFLTSGVEVRASTSFQITSGGGGGGPMTDVTLTTNEPAPQPTGSLITLSASGAGGTAPYSYRFWIQPWATAQWEIVRDWSTTSTFTWVPTVAGGYNLAVDARSSGGTVAEVQSGRTYQITAGGGGSGHTMTGVSVATNVPSPQALGTGVILTASGSGGTEPYAYRFWVQPWASGVWQIVQDWSPTARHAWIPTVAGGYNLTVEARSAGASDPDVHTTITFSVTGDRSAVDVMTAVTLTQSPSGPQGPGTLVTWAAAGSGGAEPYSYRFWVQPWGGTWQIVRDWSESSVWEWQPTVVGGYNVAVEGRSRGAVAAQVQVSDVFLLSAP